MKFSIWLVCLFISTVTFSQSKKVELYDLIKKLIPDSSEYEVVGDWSVGKPSAFPVKWKADKLEMSPDERINFFRNGTADILLKGQTAGKWLVMIMGARSGFSSFKITSATGLNLKAKTNIDSLLGKKQYTYTLIKKCDQINEKGFYYYRLQLPKKEIAWLKISWHCTGSQCAVVLDCFDDWMKQYADLNCPR